MSPWEVLPYVVTAIGGGMVGQIVKPLVALLMAKQRGQMVAAEAHRVETEASATPFDQAWRIIKTHGARIEVLEERCEELTGKLSDCLREKAVLQDRQARRRRRAEGEPP